MISPNGPCKIEEQEREQNKQLEADMQSHNDAMIMLEEWMAEVDKKGESNERIEAAQTLTQMPLAHCMYRPVWMWCC